MPAPIENERAANTTSDHRAKHDADPNSSGAPAITRSMLGLCSAPCKALRFASTALPRGLRALTLPARRPPAWQLRDVRQCADTPRRILIVDVRFERR